MNKNDIFKELKNEIEKEIGYKYNLTIFNKKNKLIIEDISNVFYSEVFNLVEDKIYFSDLMNDILINTDKNKLIIKIMN